MCGIVGVVDFSGAGKVRAQVEAMVAALAHRGPSGSDVWSADHAALGVARLAVVDVAGGHQPMVSTGDGGPAVLAYSGEVYNFAALRRELQSYGHEFHTTSDTEVVLRSFRQWGPGCAERFVGMFAFAVWDSAAETVHLIRDRFGVFPLYYSQVGNALYFASEPKGIFAGGRVRPEADLDSFRELLSYAKTPGHGGFKDVHELRPGHILRFGRAGLTLTRYWSLPAREHTDDLAATVRGVRERLTDAVVGETVSDVPWAVLLSGGLDSSAVAALAARAAGQPLQTFSVDFADQNTHFHTDEVYQGWDAPYVEEMVAHLDSHHRNVILSTAEMLDPNHRAIVALSRDIPVRQGDLDTSLYLLGRAVRQHASMVLTGIGGDELFGGYPTFTNSAYADTDTFPWVALVRAAKGRTFVTDLLDPQFAKALDIAAYEADRYREALSEVEHLPRETADERRMRQVRYLHLTRFVQIVLDQKDRLGMAAGIEGRVPFMDHRLAEYVYNAPWSMLIADGREKSLLRAAVADLLPAGVLRRPKSAFPAIADPAYGVGLAGELGRLLNDHDAPVRPLLQLEAVRAVQHDLLAADGRPVNRNNIELILSVDAWLRRCSAVRV